MVKAIKVADWFGHVSKDVLPAMAVGQATDALNQTASLRINVR